MKTILSILLLACLSAQSAVVTVTLHFTNRTQIGNTFTNGSRVVTYTNSPLSPQTWLSTNSPSLAATQLFRYFGGQYPGYYTRMTNATNVTITGLDLQLSFNTNYAVWSTNSSTATNGWIVTLPFLNQVETNRTNTASELVSGLGLYSTNAFPTNATALQNYLSLGPQTQTISNKIALNNTNVNGITTNGVYTNGVIGGGTLAGTITSAGKIKNGDLTNTAIDRAFLTNASGTLSNVIAHTLTATNFSAPGTGLNSTQIGPGSDASGDYAVAIGLNNISSATASTALGGANEATGDFSVAIGSGNQAQGDWSFAGGENSVAGYDNSFVYGSSVSADYGGQAKFGTDLYISGFMYAASGYTNGLFKGTNIFNSEICLTPRSASGFGNGYNSGFSLGTNAYIRISGPSAAYTNSSFKGGYAGLFVFYEADNPASSFVILNRSTIGAPTSAEKVNTTTGALSNQTNNPATGWLIHNGTEWILGPHSD